MIILFLICKYSLDTVNNKINGTSKSVKRYYAQINSVPLKLNEASKWASKQLGVPFILLLTVQGTQVNKLDKSFFIDS